MIKQEQILALRLTRQRLTNPVTTDDEYESLYRDLQPGLNEYWNGFGQPPVLSFRAAFDDIEFNRRRQLQRTLIKGRFAGGNIGWILPEDLELFGTVYRKPLDSPTFLQLKLWELIQKEGPMTIQQIKEATGMLVKEITPILHRLQEAFLIYEDQYDGEWDRGWFQFQEMFPDITFQTYSKQEALIALMQRFAYRIVFFTEEMAKSYFRISKKDLGNALQALTASGILIHYQTGYILASDQDFLEQTAPISESSLFVLHRNDFLVRAHQQELKEAFSHPDYETLQYLLIDGEFHGACFGKFRYGPNDLEDVMLDLSPELCLARKEEIIAAIQLQNGGPDHPLRAYQGIKIA